MTVFMLTLNRHGVKYKLSKKIHLKELQEMLLDSYLQVTVSGNVLHQCPVCMCHVLNSLIIQILKQMGILHHPLALVVVTQ